MPKEPGNFQGVRSKNLWELDHNLHRAIMLKIMSCYYDVEYIDLSWDKSIMKFTETPRYSENKNDARNIGWIHQDAAEQYQFAGLIYLTPDIDPDCGTSLFNLKSINPAWAGQTGPGQFLIDQEKGLLESRPDFALFKDQQFEGEKFTKIQIEHEEKFFEKVRFQNIFNRLVIYDAYEWHRGNSFYTDDGKDARLTLNFFVGGINGTPLERIKNSEYDTVIDLQIEKIKA